jgi:deoxyribodipyrimidine photolyase
VKTAVVHFNRDLRVHDNPALAAAALAERTVPLFVFDERLLGSRFAAPNRVAFMREALLDLDAALKRAGGRLFVRHGDPVAEALTVARECGAEELHVSADYSAYAKARERRLAAACAEERIGFHAHPWTTIVPPGAVTPGGGDHFKIFTPLPPRLERVAATAAGRAAAQARRAQRAQRRPRARAREADRRHALATTRERRRGGGAAAGPRLPPRRRRRL